MQDSGGADTCGWAMPITSAVAILFSCFDWGTGSLGPLAIGRARGPLVTKHGLTLSWHCKGTNPKKEKFRPWVIRLTGFGDYSLPPQNFDAGFSESKRQVRVLQIQGQPTSGEQNQG